MQYAPDEQDETPSPRRRFRLMHLTMVMLSLLFVSKLTEVATGASQLLAVRDAQASSAPKEDAAKKEEGGHGGGDKKEEGGHGGDDKQPAKEPVTHGAGKMTIKEVEALKAANAVSPYTRSELDLLQNLTLRRDELDAREKELQLKAKVLEAAEKRINDKVKEMKDLEVELSKVVAQYQQQQDGEIKSLVKIYESMKPGDAAAIFNEMDMPILLEVIDKMSERKAAPVLAGMDPRRARDVTQELAEMRRGRAALNRAAAVQAAPAN
jgi:flagellar motility protein MotE (MotC chaperone)